MTMHKYRYTISVDPKVFQQIEDYRFEKRFQTRAEATAELIRRGLEVSKGLQEGSDDPRSASEVIHHRPSVSGCDEECHDCDDDQ